MKERISDWASSIFPDWYMPDIKVTDVIEIIIIAYLLYQLMKWIKNTKAWMLLKGISVLGIAILVAALFRMNTILWLAEKSLSVLAVAVVVVFQPELRRALEQLGQKKTWSKVLPINLGGDGKDLKFSDETADAIVNACYELGSARTGALIVVENEIVLSEYEHTGIELDSLVSSQLLINIFEHNTPLHDGAVIIRGDRITAATCYLPLTEDSRLSKDLGTRHRAAVGMSEVSDALVIVVSEETGQVSYALGGNLAHDVRKDRLRGRLSEIQQVPKPEGKKRLRRKENKS